MELAKVKRNIDLEVGSSMLASNNVIPNGIDFTRDFFFVCI